jgi:4'-phosphopantetheinyl transferase
MQFFSPEQVLAQRSNSQVEPGCVHVWPLLFESRAALRPLMRHVLGMYCGVDGATLEFVEGFYGKPAFAEHQPFARAISFNLTHSGNHALLAVSDGREIGVDLEQVRTRTRALALADRYFFGAEFEVIRAAPETQRQDLFIRYWAAKEAVIKAQGTGLSAPLDRFRILFDSTYETAAVETFDPERIAAGWFVRAVPVGAGWHAAVAAKTRDWRVRVMAPTAAL